MMFESLEPLARTALRTTARVGLRRHVRLHVEGLENVPATGPVVVAAHHFHNLYDGAVLVASLPRAAHIMVALDWVQDSLSRRVMESACSTARWPVVLRGDGLRPPLVRDDGSVTSAGSAFNQEEQTHYLRRAVRDTVNLLREDRLLIIFPEAYPVVDPNPGKRENLRDADDFLPFEPGFLRLVKLAQSGGRTPVAIIPAGLYYRRLHGRLSWEVTLRYGAPLYLGPRDDRAARCRAIAEEVRFLSRDPNATPSSPNVAARA